MKDFFISYNRHDRAWAEWIAWTLEEAGYTTVIQAWDFRTGGNFVLDMQKVASAAKQTIAVLSETYLKSVLTVPEWAAAFAQDPIGKNRTLIPVRVKECQITGLLRPLVYIDLVDVAEAEAKDVLLRSFSQDRNKPDQQPRFPGSTASLSDYPKPVFPSTTPSNLPSASTVFVGREDDLEHLHAQIQSKATLAISAISGMGGIGKTELAAQYALQQRDMGTYPGGICWLKAREDLGTQVVLFAQSHLGLEIPDDLELTAQVTYCWRNWHPGETLIVFDDVQHYEDIKPVLPPQRSQFRVLLTTRLTLPSPVQNFEITVLSEEKVIELLRVIVPDERVDQDLATAKRICHWLGYLPLGVELVGRYLARKPNLSLTILWQRLQDKSLDAIAFKQAEPEMTASLGVAAAFELIWQALEKSAQQVAAVLSLFALAEIPWTLVEACLPENDPEALEDLRDESLINLHLLERTGQGMYQLHKLVREFFAAKREQMAEAAELKRSFRSAVLGAAYKSTQTPGRSLFEETSIVIPHLQAVVQISETSEQYTNLAIELYWLAELYRLQGRYIEAEPLYTHALDIQERQLGADHPDVAQSLNNLALLYQSQGRYIEAEPLYARALAIQECQLGADHPDVAQSLNNLANLYQTQGRYAEAAPLYTHALDIREYQLGADHPDVAQSLNNLAYLYQTQGRYAEAAPLYTRALDIQERQLGADHPAVATSLNNLAALYESQGRYAEAAPLYTRALDIQERQLGADHPAVATSLNNLAGLYRSQERYAEAESLQQRSLAIFEQQLGADHPDVAASLNNLAELYSLQERYTEAEALYLRSLAIREQQLGVEHPAIATSLSNLANLYSLQGRYGEAEPLYLRALAIMFSGLGADHPNTQTVWQNFLNFLNKVIRDKRAESLVDSFSQMTINQLRGEAG